ncbi:gluconate permease [Clostridioides difficile]|uniref:Divalent ion symporter n=15 Tax=Clostridioides difficile TaxID=1496 RepID=Q186U5_CLOD6|nr:GntP family permease [Clostridioides difficile]OFU00232.1 gluconate:proton symporter [Clostridium sp. HMSC19E03]OFU13305.1 gluconate:proton symporter [Clostridium sp. HMSC19C09]OFU17336.1 gluconate:proton symporter [Clostridium sp. HMSC19C08]OFU24651.1 gluconate:proton symporter [Clostridium sp. HMSC19C05]OFU30345.1 gluconate:proton symporter [Clostridium sp. HMSC19B10]OFU35266.1 gluconate:proton symporter [Clostridium sp. HMSC19B04]OFU41238.1 gluconate:proton symporter [Clostridium sp. H
MQITTFGAIFGLLIAIILIIKKFQAVYSLMLGAFIGGLVGGANITQTVDFMANGAMNISPSILRALASGVLAGSLIKTGAVDKISEQIVKIFGEKRALFSIAISTMVLAGVGVNLDVSIITVAPIGLYIGRKLNYSKLSILLAMLGGGKAGNIISPNPNTIAVADNFSVNLSSVMMANIIPAIIGVVITVILASILINKGNKVQSYEILEQREDLPSLFKSLCGPIIAIFLLFLGNVSPIVIDPMIALPIGGIVTLIVTGNLNNSREYLAFGLSKMQGVCILLLGTGTIAGIIQMSELQQSTIGALQFLNMPQFLLAPVSGILMSLATASSTAGATIASSTFHDAIINGGLSPISGASIVNAGSSVFEQLPHGSLFHTSSGSINMDIGERFKLIPYEALIGIVMTIISTSIQLVL